MRPLAATGQSRIAQQISSLIVAATMIALPFFISIRGNDVFRLPKELLLLASGIALAAVAICANVIAVPNAAEGRWSRAVLVVLICSLLWSAVATLTSTNPELSIFSLLNVAASAMFFVAAYDAVQRRSTAVLFVALGPALLTALIAIAQRMNLWQPLIFPMGVPNRLKITALLGNPNDVGMYLVAPAVAAATLSIVSPKGRIAVVIITAVLAAGLVASDTLGALAAFCAGLFVLLLRVRPRTTLLGMLGVLLIAGAFVRLSSTRWQATRVKISEAAHGNIDPLLSGRLPAFFAALHMFQQHPITGVGLGCFPFHYFDSKIANELEHPWLINRRDEGPVNFGEVHNEHLQILAETGLPGYALFIAGLVILGSVSFRRITEAASHRQIFARSLALPLAIAMFVLCLSAFPLHLAAPTSMLVFFSAMTLAWSCTDECA